MLNSAFGVIMSRFDGYLIRSLRTQERRVAISNQSRHVARWSARGSVSGANGDRCCELCADGRKCGSMATAINNHGVSEQIAGPERQQRAL